MESDALFEEDFGQKVDLTRRIREILRNYPSGLPIISELVQNADDAGARTVKFCFDERQHPTERISSPKLAVFQGPSLLVFNDAAFTEADFMSIQNIGASVKIEDVKKTGRFGLGFNAVYHLTDVPSFVSGRHIVYFDPQAKFLPSVNAANPGKRIDFLKAKKSIDSYSDQFDVFKAFGCTLNSKFNHTLFRFPLRNEQLKSSKLSNRTHSKENMMAMQRALIDELPSLLLFLKNLESVEWYHWKPDAAQPELMASVDVRSAAGAAQKQMRAKRAFLASLDPEKGLAENLASVRIVDYLLNVTVKIRNGANDDANEMKSNVEVGGVSTVNYEWLVANQLGGKSNKPQKFCVDPEHQFLKLLPWGGVAALVGVDSQKEPIPVVGRAFCFLSLPVHTSFPVHVNGYFELSSNRRDLWFGNDSSGDGRIRSMWNQILLSDVIAPCYARALKKISERVQIKEIAWSELSQVSEEKSEALSTVSPLHAAQTDEQKQEYSLIPEFLRGYYAMWPVNANADLYAIAMKALYRLLGTMTVMYTPKLGGNSWLAPRSTVVVDPSELSNSIAHILLMSAPISPSAKNETAPGGGDLPPLTWVPSSQLRLLDQNKSSPDRLSPDFVRLHLRRHGLAAGWSDTQKFTLLRYVLSDVELTQMFTDLIGIPLLPRGDGSWDVFAPSYSTDVAYVTDDETVRKLFEPLPKVLLRSDMDSHLKEVLTSELCVSNLNLDRFDPSILAKFLPKILPSSWSGAQMFPRLEEQAPTDKYFTILWRFLSTLKPKELTAFADLPILPVHRGADQKRFACNLNCQHLIQVSTFPEEVKHALRVCGANCIDSAIVPGSMATMKSYALGSSLDGFAGVVRSIQRLSDPTVVDTFNRLEVEMRLKVHEFVVSNQHEIAKLAPKRRDVLKSLALFEVHAEGTDPAVASGASDEKDGGVDKAMAAKVLVDLGSAARYLPPNTIPFDQRLFYLFAAKNTFLRCDSAESEALLKALGVKRMDAAHFLRAYVFAGLPAFEKPLRDATILLALENLGSISAHDRKFESHIQNVKCIPTRDGGLKAPVELYDPKESILTEILDPDEDFPAAPFDTENVLLILRRLGLRSTITHASVLEIAQSIHFVVVSKAFPKFQAVRTRARSLLQYLDMNSRKFFPKFFGSNKKETLQWAAELRMLQWIPVCTKPPKSHLPWRTFEETDCFGSLAQQQLPQSEEGSPIPMGGVAVQSKAELVSYALRVVDYLFQSRVVPETLGFVTESIPTSVVAQQLIEYAKLYHKVVDAEEYEPMMDEGDEKSDSDIGVTKEQLKEDLLRIVPQLYKALTHGLRSSKAYDAELQQLRSMLRDESCIWAGGSFKRITHVAFSSPVDVRPFLDVISPEYAGFQSLFSVIGVKDAFTPEDYADVMDDLAEKYAGSPLLGDDAKLAINLSHYLADNMASLQNKSFQIPDAKNVLRFPDDLVVNDIDWLTDEKYSLPPGKHFVNPNISATNAKRLRASSFRTLLVSLSSGKLEISIDSESKPLGLKAFGQRESLCQRLKNILALYPEGPSIFYEMIQNADDAGATEVVILLNKRSYGSKKLLRREMSQWQGPALYFYNNAKFTEIDFKNLSKIGQNSKLDKIEAVGRFGLGFNAVYHLTDVPSFVSNGSLVFFDPHRDFLPEGLSQPGIRLDFAESKSIVDTFPDQFEPFLFFGNDNRNTFDGTLFRFPLRSENAARTSQIKRDAFSSRDMLQMAAQFQVDAAETLLFLRNVTKISCQIADDDDTGAPPRTLFDVSLRDAKQRANSTWHRMMSTMMSVPAEKVNGKSKKKKRPQREFYHALRSFLDKDLPQGAQTISIRTTTCEYTSQQVEAEGRANGAVNGPQPESVLTSRTATEKTFLLYEKLGGGKARDLAVDKKNADLKFLPWGGVAAQISESTAVTTGGSSSESKSSESNFSIVPLKNGRAFTFLPLPLETGLPIHVNGYFELTANRRDLWWGNDLKKRGKTRYEWNVAMLCDVIAPAYIQLMREVASRVGTVKTFEEMAHVDKFYSLWPTSPNINSQWASLQATFHAMCKEVPLIFAPPVDKGGQGVPLRGKDVVLAPLGQQKLLEIYTKHRLNVCQAPPPVFERLIKAGALRGHGVADCRFIQQWLQQSASAEKLSDEDTQFLLTYCMQSIDTKFYGSEIPATYEHLLGVLLIPMCDGSRGRLSGPDSQSLYLTDKEQMSLLKAVASDIIDTTKLSDASKRHLMSDEMQRRTNITKLDDASLAKLLQRILPPLDVGAANASDLVPWSRQDPPEDWIRSLWQYLSTVDYLEVFEDLHIVPVGTPEQIKDSKSSLAKLSQRCLIDCSQFDEKTIQFLNAIGCLCVDSTLIPSKPQFFNKYVHDSTVRGMLKCIGERLTDVSADVDACFGGVSGELRSHFVTRMAYNQSFSKAELELLRSLPIFESRSVSEEKDCFVNMEGERFLAPANVDPLLLTKAHINGSPEGINCHDFFKKLGAKEVSRKQFVLNNVFPRFSLLDVTARTKCVLDTLRSNNLKNDAEVQDYLRDLKFVPSNQQGDAYFAPKMLYDPSKAELSQMLPASSFPGEPFTSEELILILRSLGLRQSLSLDGVLGVAHSVSQSKDHDKGVKLLQYIDKHWGSLEDEYKADHVAWNRFQSSLRSLAWLPVYTKRPNMSFDRDPEMKSSYADVANRENDRENYSVLPWPAQSNQELSSVENAPNCQLEKDIWLCSYSKRIVVQKIANPKLIKFLDFHSPLTATVLITQLIALGELFNRRLRREEEAKNPPSSPSRHERSPSSVFRAEHDGANRAFEMKRVGVVVESLYEHLDACNSAEDLKTVSTRLAKSARVENGGVIWLGVKHGFTHPKYVAFQSEDCDGSPYLWEIPPALKSFDALFQRWEVRRTFEIRDYATALVRIFSQYKQRTLPDEVLGCSVRILNYLGQSDEDLSRFKLYAPTTRKRIAPADHMVFNDAQWLNRDKNVTLVHEDISEEVAFRIGVRSLRNELLAANHTKTTQGFCTGPYLISQVLKSRNYGIPRVARDDNGDVAAAECCPIESLLFGMLETADTLQSTKFHVVLDGGTYESQSVLNYGLQDCQGPALSVHFDQLLNLEELGQLHYVHTHADDLVQKPKILQRNDLSPQFRYNPLIHLYHLGDVLFVISGENLFVFDPTNSHFIEEPNARDNQEANDAAAIDDKGVVRVFNFLKSNMAREFVDQFKPFSVFNFDGSKPIDGTMVRVPLRTQKSDLSQNCPGPKQMSELIDRFVDSAEECLLFTHSINDICVSKCNTTPTSKPNPIPATSFSNPTPASDESKSALTPAPPTPAHNRSGSTSSSSRATAQPSSPNKPQPAVVSGLSEVQGGTQPESSPRSRKTSVSKPSRGRRRKNSRLSKADGESKDDGDGEPADPFPNIPATDWCPKQRFRVYIENIQDEVRAHRRKCYESQQWKQGLMRSLWNSYKFNSAEAATFDLQLKSVRNDDDAQVQQTSTWVVSQHLASADGKREALRYNKRALDLRQLSQVAPRGAIALLVRRDGRTAPKFSGRIFCTVPTNSECTGLPAHINGCFLLDHLDKLHLVEPPPAAAGGNPPPQGAIQPTDKQAWNSVLMTRDVVSAYRDVIRSCVQLVGASPKILYKFWPTSDQLMEEQPRAQHSALMQFMEFFCLKIVKLKAFLNSNRKFSVLGEDFFPSKGMSQEVVEFVSKSVSLYVINPSIPQDLKKFTDKFIKEFEPSTMRRILQRGQSKLYDSVENNGRSPSKPYLKTASKLLEFVLTDANEDASVYRQVRGMRLAVMRNGPVRLFVKSGNEFVLATIEQQLLFPNYSSYMHRYCLENEELAKHFKSDTFRAATQIREFGSCFVSRNLSSLFTNNFRSESFVEWKVDMPDKVAESEKKDDGEKKKDDEKMTVTEVPIHHPTSKHLPSREWISLLWKHLRLGHALTLEHLKEWPLIPLSSGHLTLVDNFRHLMILKPDTEDNEIRSLAEALTQIRYPILDMRFFDADQHSYLVPDERAFFEACPLMLLNSLEPLIIERRVNFDAMTRESALILVRFFADAKRRGVQWDESHKSALRRIPMFELMTNDQDERKDDEPPHEGELFPEGALRSDIHFTSIVDDEKGAGNDGEKKWCLLAPDCGIPTLFREFLYTQRCVLVHKFPDFHSSIGIPTLSEGRVFSTFLRSYLEAKLAILRSGDPLDDEDVSEDERKKHSDEVESAFVEVDQILTWVWKRWRLIAGVHDDLKASLSTLKFVRIRGGAVAAPKNLFDPRVNILEQLFAGENVFPRKTPRSAVSWNDRLDFLRELGLKHKLDREVFTECARRVEYLNQQAQNSRNNQHAKRENSRNGFSFADESKEHKEGDIGSPTRVRENAGSGKAPSRGIWSLLEPKSSDENDTPEDSIGFSVPRVLFALACKLVEELNGGAGFVERFSDAAFCLAVGQVAFVPCLAPEDGQKRTKSLCRYRDGVMREHEALAWTVRPVFFGREPQELWARKFGISRPPNMKDVVSHLSCLSKIPIDRWKFHIPHEKVYDTLLSHFAKHWKDIPAALRQLVRDLPVVPIGSLVLRANRLFLKLEEDLAPFMFEVPRVFSRHARVLQNLGAKEAATVEDYSKFLREVYEETAGKVLNINELNAVLKVLSLLAGRIKPGSALLQNLAVPTESGTLLPSSACVYADSVWLSSRIDHDHPSFRFVSSRLSREMCATLLIPLLSEAVEESLEKFASSTLPNGTHEAIQREVFSSESLVGGMLRVWRAKLEAQSNFGQWKSLPSTHEILKSLKKYKVVCCKALKVTIKLATPPQHVVVKRGDDAREVSERTLVFVDTKQRAIFVRYPDCGVSLEFLLAVALNKVFGMNLGSMISPLAGLIRTHLLSMEHPIDLSTKVSARTPSILSDLMEIPRTDHQQNALLRGVPGEPLTPEDLAFAREQPLHQFLIGETVAVPDGSRDGNTKTHIYGTIVDQERDNFGILSKLKVQCDNKGDPRVFTSNKVLCFRSNISTALDDMASGVSDSALASPSTSSRVSSRLSQLRPPASESSRSASSVGSALSPANGDGKYDEEVDLSQVDSVDELVATVSSIFSRLNIEPTNDKKLLTETLALRKQLQEALEKDKEHTARINTLESELESANVSFTCTICQNNSVDTVCVPCGHLICDSCLSQMHRRRCHMCRAHITGTTPFRNPLS